MATTEKPKANPSSLLAIAIAGRKSGDRELTKAALRELREGHGIKISFCSELQADSEAKL